MYTIDLSKKDEKSVAFLNALVDFNNVVGILTNSGWLEATEMGDHGGKRFIHPVLSEALVLKVPSPSDMDVFWDDSFGKAKSNGAERPTPVQTKEPTPPEPSSSEKVQSTLLPTPTAGDEF